MIIINYVVKQGDTLYGISNQFGVSANELAKINNVNALNLKVGQTLTIPNALGSNPSTMFMYTVKKGDSLYSISKKYYTTVNDIKSFNNLKTNTLYIGQILRIPEIYTKEDEMYAPSYKSYTVKKGDTLYTIARDNNLSVEQILKDNSITNNIINVGQILKIRINDETIADLECFGREYEPLSENITFYEVKRGDNLYSIAKKFNTTIQKIKSLNDLKSDVLTIGQILKIEGADEKTYTVVKGDNLYNIARKFNTSVEQIKKKNNLSTNVLSIGQKLVI